VPNNASTPAGCFPRWPGQLSSPFSLRLHLFSPSRNFTSVYFPFASPLPSFSSTVYQFLLLLLIPSFPLCPAASHRSLVRHCSTSQAPLVSSPPSSPLSILHPSSLLNFSITAVIARAFVYRCFALLCPTLDIIPGSMKWILGTNETSQTRKDP
jgi:hypothetical protein